jgi:SAM-dependent methyltransferase
MAPEHRARLSDGRLQVPRAAHAALGRPRRVALAPQDDGSILLKPDPLWRVAMRVPRVALGVGPDVHNASLEVEQPGHVVFATDAPLSQGDFGIANYETFLALIPLDPIDERQSREQTWGSIQDYHEHLAPSEQQTESLAISRWLAEDVLVPLGGASYLELGCGAGRNLAALQDAAEDLDLRGIDINAEAVRRARAAVPAAVLAVGTVHDLSDLSDGSVDVVYTSGVLMHIPHADVSRVIHEMHRVARVAAVHFELHGPSHDFDFHRYPRDYQGLYSAEGLASRTSYAVYPRGDFRSATTGSFEHALRVHHVG